MLSVALLFIAASKSVARRLQANASSKAALAYWTRMALSATFPSRSLAGHVTAGCLRAGDAFPLTFTAKALLQLCEHPPSTGETSRHPLDRARLLCDERVCLLGNTILEKRRDDCEIVAISAACRNSALFSTQLHGL